MGYDFELLQTYGPKILWGLVITLKLVFTASFISLFLAIPLALLRNSNNPILSSFARGYIVFFRGTPLLAQLFLIYYGSGQIRGLLDDIGLWWLFKDAFYCAVLAFTMNTTAYQAEILRGAISSIPKGQREAARTIGLSPSVTFLRILLPQAMIIALRPLGNELILMLKASALVSVITVPEVMQATDLAFARSFEFQVYLWAAVLYLAMVELVRRIWVALENILTRHMRKDTDQTGNLNTQPKAI